MSEAERPTSYRYAPAFLSPGQWDKEGLRQQEFLVMHGLKPNDFYLDVGCGPLRGGLQLIPYLEPGHYFGIDVNANALREGQLAVEASGMIDRSPHLVLMNDFDFTSLGVRFGYMLAKSVFTHLPLNSIIRCIMNADRALAPGGRFYATFFENERGKLNLDPIARPMHETHFDQNPYHYDVATFEWICEGTGLSVKNVGPWNPNGGPQNTLEFVKCENDCEK